MLQVEALRLLQVEALQRGRNAEPGIRNLHHAPPGTEVPCLLRGLFDETRGPVSYRESNHAGMEQHVAANATMVSHFQPPP